MQQNYVKYQLIEKGGWVYSQVETLQFVFKRDRRSVLTWSSSKFNVNSRENIYLYVWNYEAAVVREI